MQVDLTLNIRFPVSTQELAEGNIYLRLHDLHDDCKEDGKPSLSQEIVENQTAWKYNLMKRREGGELFEISPKAPGGVK